MFTSLITGKILGVLSVALLIALLSFGAYHFFIVKALERTITDQQTKLSELTVENGALTIANLQMSKSIDLQNTRIKEMVVAQNEAMEIAARRIDEVARKAKVTRAKYEQLLASPKPEGDICQAVESKVDAYLALRMSEEITVPYPKGDTK